MSLMLPSLESANVNEKRVFVRCDFDVPLSEQPASPAGRSTINNQQLTVADDTRLVSAVSTIEYLLEQGATVIAAGHLGRPGDQYQISNIKSQMFENEFSLRPIAEWFAEEFPGASLYKMQLNGFPAWQIKRNFYILENLRLFDGEEANSQEFAEKLADLADIYINEAFGSSHRAHTSMIGVPKLLPHYAGFHLSKEVKILSNLLANPKRPLTIIVGGAKIETKLPLVSKMHSFADYVLVGGELAEQDKILIKEQHKDITSQKALLIVADLNKDKSDITNMSLENFLQIISRSKCVVWNGPLGFIEEGMVESSLKLAEAIIASSAYKVVGGGDTVAFLNQHNLLSKFDFVSTGGGAMLQFLSGKSLPGIIALQN